jgi:hypothetical protein
MPILLAFTRKELARWLSKLKITRSRGAPGPTPGAGVQKGVKHSAKGKARQSKCIRL